MRLSLGPIQACLSISICGLAMIGSAARAADPARSVAREAKRTQFAEVAYLKFTGEKGATLIEHGRATGTYVAPMVAGFTLHEESHKEYVAAVVTIYPPGGSITGTARAEYKTVGSLYYFGGLFTVGRGTGKYRHISEVHSKALGFSGIFNHKTLDVEVKTKGEVVIGS